LKSFQKTGQLFVFNKATLLSNERNGRILTKMSKHDNES
jgi:hypothetical protein